MSRRHIIGFGDTGFERAVERYERQIIREVKRIVAETSEMAVSQMKALAPVGEGALKSSIDVKFMNRGLSAFIIVGVHYGIYVEYGTGIYSEHPTIPGRQDAWVYKKDGKWYYTKGMRAQPFFHPALEHAFIHFRNEMNRLG
jgi:HK97 gp10 family phage protein